MKITVFNGSPRGPGGNTHFIVSEFCQGAQEAGAEIHQVFLAHKTIHHCMGCFSCWIRTPGRCVHKDDMAGLLERFCDAEVIVLATPVYIDNVTGLMKNFLDRLIPLALPYFEKDQTGQCRHAFRRNLPKKFVVVSNCGFPEQSHFEVVRLWARRMMRNFGGELAGEIYRGGGELFRSPVMRESPLAEDYRAVLRQAGREVGAGGAMATETSRALEQPIVPDESYIAASNAYWDAELAKIEKKELE